MCYVIDNEKEECGNLCIGKLSGSLIIYNVGMFGNFGTCPYEGGSDHGSDCGAGGKYHADFG